MLTSFNTDYQSFYHQEQRIPNSMKAYLKAGFSLVLCLLIVFSIGCGSSSSGGNQAGSHVEITTDILPSGQHGSYYTTQIMASGGSEEYLYSAENLPNGLSIDENGIISGEINVEAGEYLCKVIVKDNNFDTNIVEKQFTIVIVNYLTDAYEPDDNFPDAINEENIIMPGDGSQDHTFHINSDEDYITLDLTDVTSGDVILIKTEFLTARADTNLTLYDFSKSLIQNNNDTDKDDYAVIIFKCDNPDIYYLKVEEWDSNVGDYRLSVVNTGTEIGITNTTLRAGITGGSYSEKIEAIGGGDDYIYSAENLPSNLVIDEDGNLTGTISAVPGEYTINVTATDKQFPAIKIKKELVLNILDEITVTPDSLPDALINSPYTTTITATGGSGNYIFSVENLPGNLNISTSGVITGTVAVTSGYYNFKVIVADATYENIIAEKNINLAVVDFLSDDYEQNFDNDFTTTNIIQPGEKHNHTFNYIADEDYCILDLTSVAAGSIISIQTSYLSSATDTTLILFNKNKNLIAADSNSGAGDYSTIVFTCDLPDIYYLKVEETHRELGDYTLSVVNTGMPVQITTTTIPDALTNSSYLAQIQLTGGSGNYIVGHTGLPSCLNISPSGTITSTAVTLLNGSYNFVVIAEDAENNHNNTEQLLTLNVVNYFPDAYEPDGDFSTTNTMAPGATPQNHSFHNNSDDDFVELDLTGVTSGDVIQIKTEFLSSVTDTNIELFDSNQNPVDSDNNTGIDNYSLLLYQCDNPDIYYIKVTEWNRNVGDYTLSVVNTGTPITITSTVLEPAIVGLSYNEQIYSTGSTNNFNYTVNNLPSSLVIGENSGIISGTVTTPPGAYQFILTVSDTTYPEKKIAKEFTLEIISNLEITTTTLSDALSANPYSAQLEATGGSGDYQFTAINLPASLTISASGLITGDVTVSSGNYNLTARVTDTVANITVEKLLYLNIVDFFPDARETAGDNDFSTTNTVKPNDATQYNTLNYSGDEDFIKLDLTGVAVGDMIKINTSEWTQLTDTYMTLYHADSSIITSNNNDGNTAYSEIIFQCVNPGIYYISVKSVDNKTGDYQLTTLNVGPAVQVTTTTIPDVLNAGAYNFQVEAIGGSGNYIFTANNLPNSLTINSNGLITGSMTVNTGSYPFTVHVEDTTYAGIFTDKDFTLNVVDFFPDTYEIAGDNNFSTTNTMVPGETSQNHTFNYIDDEDFIKIDLTDVNAGDVIKFNTGLLTQATDTYISLYNDARNFLTADSNSGSPVGYSQIIFECINPGIYYVQINESNHNTGDYNFSVINTGSKVQINTASTLADALKASPYSVTIEATGGSGSYKYSATNLPANLTISTTGVLSGGINTTPGIYTFPVRAEDTTYTGIFVVKDLTLNVVDFFPDTHEIAGDNDFSTTNTMAPGATPQNHTFNSIGDEDYIKLNFNSVDAGDVIKIETNQLSQATDTNLILYNSAYGLVSADDNSGSENYSKIVYTCPASGNYYLRVNETASAYGDYIVSVVNTGPQVQITTTSLQDALRDNPYSVQLSATGGSGSYNFSATNLPSSLTLSNNGLLSGTVTAVQGTYSFNVTIEDSVYSENNNEINLSLKIVDFFPDTYEADNNFSTTNTIQPGGDQTHNFHTDSDIDYLKLDTTNLPDNHIVKVETYTKTKPTDTLLYLYNYQESVIVNDDNSGSGNYSKITFLTATPGAYYLKVENTQSQGVTGDYGIRITDCGEQLAISTNTLPYAESVAIYDETLQITGGKSNNRFSVISGSLPPGLSLNASTGRISGQTYTSDQYTFTVRVNDLTNTENYADKNFTIVTYIGKKVSVNGDTNNFVCGGQWCMDPRVTGLNPTVIAASNGLTYQISDAGIFQPVISSSAFVFNTSNGSLSIYFDMGNNTHINILNNLPSTITVKAMDNSFPSNFDTFTYTINPLP